MNKNSNSAHNHFSLFRNTTYAVLPYNSLSTTLIEESTRFLPFNRHSATTATYVYDCKITAWCLHEPMYFEYASFPTSGNNTAAKTQVPHTWGNLRLISPRPSFGAIPTYSHTAETNISQIFVWRNASAPMTIPGNEFSREVLPIHEADTSAAAIGSRCVTKNSVSFLYGRHIGRLAYNRFRQLATRD